MLSRVCRRESTRTDTHTHTCACSSNPLRALFRSYHRVLSTALIRNCRGGAHCGLLQVVHTAVAYNQCASDTSMPSKTKMPPAPSMRCVFAECSSIFCFTDVTRMFIFFPISVSYYAPRGEFGNHLPTFRSTPILFFSLESQPVVYCMYDVYVQHILHARGDCEPALLRQNCNAVLLKSRIDEDFCGSFMTLR